MASPRYSHSMSSIHLPELKITQPSFTSSVGGYSSYLAYPVTPAEVSNDLEAQFHFSSLVTDQVGV